MKTLITILLLASCVALIAQEGNPVEPGPAPPGESALLFDSTADRPAGPGLGEGNLAYKSAVEFLAWLMAGADLLLADITDASANGRSLVSAANYAAMRGLLDLEAGTDFLGFPTGTPDGTKFLRDDNTWQAVPGGGSSVVLDLADDGSNESTDLSEVATTGDTNSIFTEPSPNKLLIDAAQPWPLADLATTANAGDSATAFFSAGTIEFARLPMIDDDTFAAATATTGASSESVKAYIDATAFDLTEDLAAQDEAREVGAVPWHDAAVDPTVNDDLDNFSEGTVWRNHQGTSSETDDTLFQLLDDSDGAAVWVPMVRLTAAGALNVSSLDVSGDLSADTLTITGSTTPSNTTEGRVQWDTDDDNLLVGTGAGTVTAAKVGGNIGAATATTPAVDDNDTSVATTAFVQSETVAAGDVTGTIGGGLTIGAAAVSADELDEAGVEAGLEAVLDLPDLQGTLTVGKGGTGATTLTGVVKGNGTSAFTVAARSDINTVQATGNFSSPTVSNPYAPAATLMYGGCFFYGATGEIDLPAGAAGMNIIIYNTGAFTITVDPNASEAIVRDGTLQTGGVSFTLSSGAGNYVGLVWDGARWVTLGYKGTLLVGS